MAGPVPPFIRFHASFTRAANGCWLWNGYVPDGGYALIKVFGEMVSAHRYGFELYKGPIPEGAELLHSCDNKPCVNPDHLRPDTHAANMKEAAERGLMCSGEAHRQFGKPNPRPRQAHVVRVLGREFPSQKAAERTLGLGSGTVRYWILNHPQKAQILSKGDQCRA